MKNIKAVLFDLDDTLIDRNQTFIKYCHWFIENHFKERTYPYTEENMIKKMIQLDECGYGNKTKMYNKLIKSWELNNYSAEGLVNKWAEIFACFTSFDERTN